MVLGLFEGGIEVKTDRVEYSRGDTINCSCTLKLKQPTPARNLHVLFQRIEGSGKSTRYIELAKKEIGPARTYNDGERFEFTLPADANAVPEIVKYSGLTGALQNMLGNRRMQWEIRVSLDMPMKLDVSGSVFPIITRPVVQK